MSRGAAPMAADGPGQDLQAAQWTYDAAFSRHLGLLSAEEQERLKHSRVAIVGMGGVGGSHLVTLARLGVGAFHIADPDKFEVANFNRQYGARLPAIGRNKAVVMAEEVRTINPEVDLRVLAEPVTESNVSALLDGVDVLLDGVDFFALATRRLVFREARRRGIWALTAGPVGFSSAWITFAPDGMSFDAYFDLHDDMEPADQLVAFIVGLAPRATHLAYLDLRQVDPRSGRGPSAGLACQLCSGVAAAETLKILLGRGGVRPAPWAFQFDAYRTRLCQVYLWRGNRNPWQRFKRKVLRRRLSQLGWAI